MFQRYTSGLLQAKRHGQCFHHDLVYRYWMCHKLPWICSVCPNHNPVLSPFMTCHRLMWCDKHLANCLIFWHIHTFFHCCKNSVKIPTEVIRSRKSKAKGQKDKQWSHNCYIYTSGLLQAKRHGQCFHHDLVYRYWMCHKLPWICSVCPNPLW
jgi:hypothetical protein